MLQKIISIPVLALFITLGLTHAEISNAAKQKSFSGSVTRISGSSVFIKTSSAAAFSAEVGNAVLVRKYGSAMQFSEIMIGDKVQIKGALWSDNSISASYLRNMSLYAHRGTFKGQIETIDPATSKFTMQSKAGLQTVRTDGFTVFKKNGRSAALSELAPGVNVSVKGLWDRTSTDIAAMEVTATARLINIDFTGQLIMKNGNALTIIGDTQAIYGVTTNGAQLQSKNGTLSTLGRYNINDRLRVWGKHVSGTVQITAVRIKNLSR
jgi:hypothetical protein